MSRCQRVVFHPGRILFSAPRLSTSLWGPPGAQESSQGHINSPSACRRMMWLLEDLNEFQGFLEEAVCFSPCERIRQPCGHQLQRSPACWLLPCWLAAACKCCWPLKMMSHRASASPTVSPNRSHIMTPVFHLEVPAFSVTLNGFTCPDMLLMRALWMWGVGIRQDFVPNSKDHVLSHRLLLICCLSKVGRACCSSRACSPKQSCYNVNTPVLQSGVIAGYCLVF